MMVPPLGPVWQGWSGPESDEAWLVGASCGVGPASEQAGSEPGPFAIPFDITEGFF